jgi:Flp pilus assembly protein TadD
MFLYGMPLRSAGPSPGTSRLNLAVAQAELGQLERARAHAEEARQLDPREPRAAALLDRLSRR